MTLDDIRRLIAEPETPHVEFKEARQSFSTPKMLRYLCAFANEGGGLIAFGVTDKHPRRIVGSQAFSDVHSEVHNWRQTLGREITVYEIDGEPDLFSDDKSRVLVLRVEGRAPGEWVTYEKTAWVRDGESLVPMSPSRLREISLESTDMSARLVPESSFDDVDPHALMAFRIGLVARAMTDATKRRFDAQEPSELLQGLGLMTTDGTLTMAALVLVGRSEAIQRWLAQAEVIFEKRKLPTSIRYEARHPIREPLLLGLDALVSAIMPYARLDPIEIQDGTSVVQLPRYPERSVREAILNAVAHRDYTSDESVYVDLSSEQFVVTSPGAFPGDVTPENVAEKRFPRNRLLAESLEKCGRIERSGQGVDLMMLAALRLAQPLPAFEEPEGRRVRVTLTGRSDSDFLEFTSQVNGAVWEGLGIEDFRTLDAMRRRVPTGNMKPGSVQRLIDLGLAQRTEGGHLRPADQWLEPMAVAKQRRLTLDGLKDRIVRVLLQNEPAGLSIGELGARFPDQTREQLRRLLNAMRGTRVEMRGKRGGARWHSARESAESL